LGEVLVFGKKGWLETCGSGVIVEEHNRHPQGLLGSDLVQDRGFCGMCGRNDY
jgi:hypothetical protein